MSESDSTDFFKRLLLIVSFFVITPIALGVSIFSLVSLSDPIEETPLVLGVNSIKSPEPGIQVYASLPSGQPAIGSSIGSSDARVEIVRQYLVKHKSPLEPYASDIVAAADTADLDFRLTTAIAQQESNLCKVSPPGCNNCWGYGIHSQGTKCFDSYAQGVGEVSNWLRREYLNKGYRSVEEVMSKYTPLSNGSWAHGVNQFMSEME